MRIKGTMCDVLFCVHTKRKLVSSSLVATFQQYHTFCTIVGTRTKVFGMTSQCLNHNATPLPLKSIGISHPYCLKHIMLYMLV